MITDLLVVDSFDEGVYGKWKHSIRFILDLARVLVAKNLFQEGDLVTWELLDSSNVPVPY